MNTERISIFVDANNIFYAQKRNNWFFDPKLLIEFFTKERHRVLAGSFWYEGVRANDQRRAFRNALTDMRFTERSKPVKEIFDTATGDTIGKANFDVEMVVDMFNTAHHYDEAIILSGDGDFESAVESLRSRGKRIVVISTEGMIARELKNASDSYIDLKELRPFIERKRDYFQDPPLKNVAEA